MPHSIVLFLFLVLSIVPLLLCDVAAGQKATYNGTTTQSSFASGESATTRGHPQQDGYAYEAWGLALLCVTGVQLVGLVALTTEVVRLRRNLKLVTKKIASSTDLELLSSGDSSALTPGKRGTDTGQHQHCDIPTAIVISPQHQAALALMEPSVASTSQQQQQGGFLTHRKSSSPPLPNASSPSPFDQQRVEARLNNRIQSVFSALADFERRWTQEKKELQAQLRQSQQSNTSAGGRVGPSGIPMMMAERAAHEAHEAPGFEIAATSANAGPSVLRGLSLPPLPSEPRSDGSISVAGTDHEEQRFLPPVRLSLPRAAVEKRLMISEAPPPTHCTIQVVNPSLELHDGTPFVFLPRWMSTGFDVSWEVPSYVVTLSVSLRSASALGGLISPPVSSKGSDTDTDGGITAGASRDDSFLITDIKTVVILPPTQKPTTRSAFGAGGAHCNSSAALRYPIELELKNRPNSMKAEKDDRKNKKADAHGRLNWYMSDDDDVLEGVHSFPASPDEAFDHDDDDGDIVATPLRPTTSGTRFLTVLFVTELSRQEWTEWFEEQLNRPCVVSRNL